MALGDITFLGGRSTFGGRLYNVAAGTPIYAGDPVQMDLGGASVYPAVTNFPTVGTSYLVGVAETSSTNTTSAAGTVVVTPTATGDTMIIAPDVAATWDTQAEYDALVGDRVLIKNSVSVTSTPTSGTYTLLASDSANNGCVVQTLNVFVTPGRVAFAFRNGANVLA